MSSLPLCVEGDQVSESKEVQPIISPICAKPVGPFMSSNGVAFPRVTSITTDLNLVLE
ncbi:alpha-amylase [Aspergillus luchuensis]|uniref:Alpha-amylase n=1 Tax=Aspergillus kawachii TaxID=1069201 RepID=A0A146FHB4_ASPKA|nr:alpha-amylase [Aspergillus luchuensis]